ncbi:Rne/Rng family ribonuclease [Knoellia sp. LjRoot47]|uniref:Rne/Rng family ribonuclease n=1 Tax=Knoellia sp. LjRoot47 TaxID=3342330 RepID=UPI003ECE7EEE
MATHDEPTSITEGEGAPVDLPGLQDTPAPAAKAAPKRRRATKKAAAPTSAGADDTAVAPASGEDAADAPESAESAPKKKPARKAAKTSAKKSAAETEAPAVEATTDESAAVETPADDKTAGEAAPQEKPKRKRASRAKKAVAAPEPDPEPVTEVVDEDTETPEDEAEVETTETDTAETAETEAAPVVPSFGLLFQAPDVSAAPRRRRATSPAQAPAERHEAPEPAVETDTEESGDDEPTSGRRSRGSKGSSRRRGGRATTEAVAEQDDEEREERDETTDESTDEPQDGGRRRRRGGRGRRGRGGADKADQGDAQDEASADSAEDTDGAHGPSDDSADTDQGEGGSSRRRRRRRRSGASGDSDDPPGTVTKVREPRKDRDEPTAVKGSTRLEAKKQRRREGREAGRRRTIITEAEFLARRESVERVMAVRGKGDKTQIGVLEDGVLVEHYVSRESNASMAGNVYLGRVQNVLPSMEAAFVDIGKGRNAVLYAGEVNWDAAGLEQNQAKRIENAMGSGDTVLVQVTKDPIGHKGARLTSQISLPGRYLVYVPEGSMTGISRKLPDTERARLKAILKEVVPDSAGVIVRTAAEGASEEELRADVERLTKAWDNIQKKAKAAASKKASNGGAPVLLHGEADLTVRVIRDVFTEDFSELVVSGDQAWSEVSGYVEDVAPDLAKRLTHWTGEKDIFSHYRVDEQIAKAMDRKVWLPSGGSLVIDRTEAMTVVDVNTGKFVGSGGNLEETVTKNNIEAAEEIVRQLRLRDIGGIIVIDFIDMVLESNRDLVVRRLLECLGRDRTKHQVAEVTSLGLVQMTRKRVGSGLIEVFSEQCEHCAGRGIIVQAEPIDRSNHGGDHGHSHGNGQPSGGDRNSGSGRARRRGKGGDAGQAPTRTEADTDRAPATPSGPTAAQIAAAAHAAAIKSMSGEHADDDVADLTVTDLDAATQSSQPAQPSQDSTSDAEPETTVEPESVVEPDVGAQPVDQTTTADAPAAPATPVADAGDAPVAEAPVVDRAPAVIAEVGAADDAEETVRAVAQPASIAEPVVRPRRKRGRVVAPAGPPRGADAEASSPQTTPASGSAPVDLEQAEGDR